MNNLTGDKSAHENELNYSKINEFHARLHHTLVAHTLTAPHTHTQLALRLFFDYFPLIERSNMFTNWRMLIFFLSTTSITFTHVSFTQKMNGMAFLFIFEHIDQILTPNTCGKIPDLHFKWYYYYFSSRLYSNCSLNAMCECVLDGYSIAHAKRAPWDTWIRFGNLSTF